MDMTDNALEPLFTRLTRLKALKMPCGPGITPSFFTRMTPLPYLTDLDLRLSKIDAKGLGHLFTVCTALQTLNLSSCRGLKEVKEFPQGLRITR